MNILIVIAGGLIGWAVGMLMTPVSSKETKQFLEYGKAISTFVSGYLVAKLDKVFGLTMQDNANLHNEALVERVLMFVGAFVLGALCTYVWRMYLSSKEAQS